MKILLPYIKEHDKFKKALMTLRAFTPKEVEIIPIYDEKREGMTKVFNKYFTGEDDLILWHSDIYAKEGWYEELMKYYDEFDIIGTKLIYPNGLIQHFGGFIRGDLICFHPHQFCLDKGLDRPTESVFVTWGGVLVKKEVIKKVGKMDEQFFQAYYGDVDYCMSAKKEGYRIGVVPVKLIHEESSDNKKDVNLSKIMQNNYNIFKAKWMSEL